MKTTLVGFFLVSIFLVFLVMEVKWHAGVEREMPESPDLSKIAAAIDYELGPYLRAMNNAMGDHENESVKRMVDRAAQAVVEALKRKC